MSSFIGSVMALVSMIGTIEAKEGWASQYETHQLMMDTVRAQQRWNHLPEELPDVDGFVAVNDCSRLGDVIFLYREGIGVESFLIADCSGHVSTSNWMSANNILVEVGRRTAERWGVAGEGGVRVIELTGEVFSVRDKSQERIVCLFQRKLGLQAVDEDRCKQVIPSTRRLLDDKRTKVNERASWRIEERIPGVNP